MKKHCHHETSFASKYPKNAFAAGLHPALPDPLAGLENGGKGKEGKRNEVRERRGRERREKKGREEPPNEKSGYDPVLLPRCHQPMQASGLILKLVKYTLECIKCMTE